MRYRHLNRLSIIISLFVFLLFTEAVSAAATPDDQERGGGVAVFRFEASGDIQPYGTIIPESISKTVINLISADVSLVEAESSTVRRPSGETAQKLLSAIPEEEHMDYTFLVTGECSAVKSRDALSALRIKIQIIDLRNLNSEVVERVSDETGAFLTNTIDKLASDVASRINLLEIAYLDTLQPSPRIKTYSAFQGISFGMDIGRVFFRSDWGDIYDDGEKVMTRISFRKNRYEGSLNYGYIAADSSREIDMSIHSLTLSLGYSVFQSEYFSLDITAGLGGARTYIWVEGDEYDLFGSFEDEKKSLDPLFESGLFFNIYLDSLILRTGAGFRRIFLDKNMDSVNVYIGAGYRL